MERVQLMPVHEKNALCAGTLTPGKGGAVGTVVPWRLQEPVQPFGYATAAAAIATAKTIVCFISTTMGKAVYPAKCQ